MKKIISKSDGSVTVEFALVALIFFMLIFGIIEFGLLVYNNCMLTHASRVAARRGVLFDFYKDADGNILTHCNDDEIKEAALTWCENFLFTFKNPTEALQILDPERYTDVNGTKTVVTYGSENANDLLEVKLRYAYNFLFFRMLGPITLEAKTKMIFE